MRGALNDIRFGIRSLLAARGTTAVSVAIFAFCIGANTAIFSMVRKMVLRPFSGVPAQERLVAVAMTDGADCCSTAYPDYEDLRDRARSFDGMLAARLVTLNVGAGDAQRAGGQLVSTNFFDVLGVRAVRGRTFARVERDLPVAVISERLWRDRFGSSASIAGSSAILNGRAYTIIGVVPESFRGTFPGYFLDVWIPLGNAGSFVERAGSLNDRTQPWLTTFARLRKGVSVEAANADIAAVARALESEHPDTNRGRRGSVHPLRSSPYGATPILGPVLVIAGIVALLVLAIGCANITNLQLVRAVARARELTIRSAIGGRPAQLVRQVIIESVLLAVAGGACGLLLALWLKDAIGFFVPPTRVRLDLGGELDVAVLVVSAAVTIVAGVVAGLAPVLYVMRLDLASLLKEESGASTGGRVHVRMYGVLVAAQVALSVVLLIVAGLFTREMRAIAGRDPGFDRRNLLLTSLDLFANGYDDARGASLAEELRIHALQVPGVEAATIVSRVPLAFRGAERAPIALDRYVPAPDEKLSVPITVAAASYFATMRTQLIEGRDFDTRDRADAQPVCAINDAFRRKYRVTTGDRVRIGHVWRTIVAVVADGRYQRISESPAAHVFVPLAQEYRGEATLIVRVRAGGRAVPALLEALRQTAPRLSFSVRTMDDHLQLATAAHRVAGSLLAALGTVALLLASAGLYGVVSYAASRRTRELALRSALGASPALLCRLVMRDGVALAIAGSLTGAVLAFAAARLLETQLTSVSITDPRAYAGAIALVVSIALGAALLPAARVALR